MARRNQPPVAQQPPGLGPEGQRVARFLAKLMEAVEEMGPEAAIGDEGWPALKRTVNSLLDSSGKPTLPPGVMPALAASDLARRAFEAEDESSLGLAFDALRIDHHNVDAWVFLGQAVADAPDLSLLLLTIGVLHARDALGDAMNTEDPEELGNLPRAQPFIRAITALGLTLWDMGDPEAAVANLTTAMALRPADPDGLRYALLPALLEMGAHESAGEVIEAFPDEPHPAWPWLRALQSFQASGDTEAGRSLMETARALQPDVAAYLTGGKQITEKMLDDPDIVTISTLANMDCWSNTEGAIPWLKQSTGVPEPPKQAAKERRSGPRKLD